MRARLHTVVDCTAGPATVEVEGDIYDDGGSELDADLFRAMVKTQRGLADEARREQEMALVHSGGNGNESEARRLARLVPVLLDEQRRLRGALETLRGRPDMPAEARDLVATVLGDERARADMAEAAELAVRLAG